jgi:hypothetical protein
MKRNNNWTVLTIVTVFSVAVLFSCNNDKATKKTEAVKTDTIQKDTTVQVNVVLKDSTQQKVYVSYISLKNALVKSDALAVKSAAAELTTLLKAQGLKKSVAPAQLIAGSGDLKIQRKEFTTLSTELINYFKKAGLAQGKIYVQHCPMANSGDGGDWLSSEKKIQNPYYGSEMLECGAVIEEIKVK